jgi:nucleotide-binding universal stress UspA family protein
MEMTSGLGAAREDFRRARQRAAMEDLLARWQGRSLNLLSFEEVRHKLRATDMAERGLQEIPLTAIIGTTGRYSEFTRTFLPRRGVNEERWAGVKQAVTDTAGLPPIQVYKVGDAYFVRDGHHRISVARELGAESISAYVTEVQTRVPLSPEAQPSDLISKAEYVEFLEQTGLDELRPSLDLSLTEPGGYQRLREAIELYRAVLEAERGETPTASEALTRWYDDDYLPVVEIVRERGMLRDFPGRTEADLYLWVAENATELRQELGWTVTPEAMVSGLAEKVNTRLGQRLLKLVVPDTLLDGPQPGAWRKERLEERYTRRLFEDVLVPLSGWPESWAALDQAIEVVSRESGRLLGLHVVASEAARNGEAAQVVKAEFQQRCEALRFPGTLAVDVGDIARRICERAAVADLVVLHLAHPPGAQPLERLTSGLSLIIRRSPRPVLLVPGAVTPMARPLLAYDGSPKAREALFVATYLAGEWNAQLTVLTAAAPSALDYARQYLEFHEVEAAFLEEVGPPAETILRAAADQAADLILMGGYSARPLVEVVVGSTVDAVLRQTTAPILICR